MQLAKLGAAPERQAEVPPCAPAGETDGGAASPDPPSSVDPSEDKRYPLTWIGASLALVGMEGRL